MSANAKNNAITTIKSTPRIVCFRVDGLGQAARLEGPDKNLAAITDNGTGDYTITFATELQELPYIFAPMSETADICFMHHATAPTRTVVRILSKSVGTSPTATDCDFQVMMLVHTAESIYYNEVD